MATRINRLSDRSVKAAMAKGQKVLLADGGGVYAQISGSGSASWIYRYKIAGRVRDMGLGAFPTTSLADARQKAQEARKQRAEGKDPIESRRALHASRRLTETRAKTFRQAAEEYITAHKGSWRSSKHAGQWQTTLECYAFPVLGNVAVGEITTADVLNVLRPVWTGDKHNAPRPETASRLRGRLEVIIDAARVDDDSQRANPARWKGHLEHKLPKRSKIQTARHHAALPYNEVPAFMRQLRERDGIGPRALEFTILTAARSGEVVGAAWTEIDLGNRIWTVPATRMKAGKEHRVPLSPRAVAIIEELAPTRLNQFLFPGAKRDTHLTGMALLMLLRELRPSLSVHGFRSTFRDWTAECTPTPNFIAEAALAHAVADKTEAAYRRSDLLERRRELMEAWAQFCEPAPEQRSRQNLPTNILISSEVASG